MWFLSAIEGAVKVSRFMPIGEGVVEDRQLAILGTFTLPPFLPYTLNLNLKSIFSLKVTAVICLCFGSQSF